MAVYWLLGMQMMILNLALSKYQSQRVLDSFPHFSRGEIEVAVYWLLGMRVMILTLVLRQYQSQRALDMFSHFESW